MVGNACFFIMSLRVSQGMGPVSMLAGGLVAAAVGVGVLNVTGVLPATFATTPVLLAGQHTAWWVPIALLVYVCSVLAYLAGVTGGARLGSTLMSLVLLCEVLFAVGFAWVLLGETITGVQLLGAVAVTAGIGVAHAGTDPVTVPA
jgi:drug/metabolite transporter (DMT)-like permease